jgi:hypothetical protein
LSTDLAPASQRPTDVLERVARQLLQTYGPAIAVALTSVVAGHSSALAAASALGTILLGTTIKVASRLRSKPGDPLWKVILDRAGSALALQLIGLGVTDWFGLIHLDWDKALTAAVASAGLAILMYFVTPPSNPPTPVEPSTDGSYAVTDVADPADPADPAEPSSARDQDWPYGQGAADRL